MYKTVIFIGFMEKTGAGCRKMSAGGNLILTSVFSHGMIPSVEKGTMASWQICGSAALQPTDVRGRRIMPPAA